MADQWQSKTYFAFTLPNRPGELAQFAERVHDAGINLLGLWGYAEGEEHPRLSCVPDSPEKFRDFAASGGIDTEEGQTLYFTGSDEPGALRTTLQRIAEAGINLDAVECVAAGGQFGCFLWAPPEQFEALAAAVSS